MTSIELWYFCSIVQCSLLQLNLVICHRNKYWQKKNCIIHGGDANENGGDDAVDEDGVEDRDDPQKAGEDGGDGSPCYFEAEILEVVVEKHGASKSKM